MFLCNNMLFVEFVYNFVCIMFVSEVLYYYYLHLDASGLITVTSVEKLYLIVQVIKLSALSAIFDSTTIVDLTLCVVDPKTVSKI